MFKNIGKKIKTLAKVTCIVGIVLFVIVGFVTALRMVSIPLGVLVFVLYAGFGALACWAGSFVLYGFGELVENSKTTVFLQKEILKLQKAESDDNQNAPKQNKKWRCDKCGCEVNEEYTSCPFCAYVEKKEQLKKANEDNQD